MLARAGTQLVMGDSRFTMLAQAGLAESSLCIPEKLSYTWS